MSGTDCEMKYLRIMTVCGFGLGTSFVLKMTLDEVLREHHIKAETFCSDADTAMGQRFDLVLTSQEMDHLFTGLEKPVVLIDNFLSADEVEEKTLPVIKHLMENA